MPKYNYINEDIVNKFIEKVFTVIAKKKSSKVLKDLSKKDPELGSLINKAIANGKAMEKKLKRMSPKEKEELENEKHMNDIANNCPHEGQEKE